MTACRFVMQSLRTHCLLLLLGHLLTTSLVFADVPATKSNNTPLSALPFMLVAKTPLNNTLSSLLDTTAQHDIVAQVRKNLDAWHYPISPAELATFQLTATLDDISHLATPIGFSFNAGNSDPRARDFQKDDVLPIHCQLSTPSPHAEVIEHTMTFSVAVLTQETAKVKRLTQLSHDITTTCFNLLSQWQQPTLTSTVTNATATKHSAPTWLPSVHLETRPAPAAALNPNTPTQGLHDTTQQQDLIIHNQGTPLIIHIGHERR
ncbi:MAG: hypothetical protein ACOYM1_05960 [Methylovulum sp.]|jgi:hypothetical protein